MTRSEIGFKIDMNDSVEDNSGNRANVGTSSRTLDVIGRGTFPELRWLAIGQTLREGDEDSWARVEGEVTKVDEQSDGLQMELKTPGGHMSAKVGDSSGLSSKLLLNRRIRAIGFCQGAYTASGRKVPGVLWIPTRNEIGFIGTLFNGDLASSMNTNAARLPELKTAAEINQMKREEAQRGYPVKVQGVVVCVVSNRPAIIVQDGTRAVYVVVDFAINPQIPPIGSYVEVEGKTDKGSYAPLVRAGRVAVVGLGNLPEPMYPTWDQLMNGSLDDQWVELKGVIVSMTLHSSGWTLVSLRTQQGTLLVDFLPATIPFKTLKRFENALVRLRGCLFVSWDPETGQVRRGIVRMIVNDIMEDQPAPADVFSAPKKTAEELMLFDSEANAFQRVKVSGQIIYVKDAENFLMDGTNGVRFLGRQRPLLKAGDLVDVVGFPELSGAAPILFEAKARAVGYAPLPKAKKLLAGDLIRASNDSTRVQVEALLAGVKHTGTNQVLELQAGAWRFLARLDTQDKFVQSLRVGSRLELTGVYAAQGINRITGEDVASFDLLVSAPSDIKVLSQPPWWTLQRLLVLVASLACVLFFAVLWITQLHRQVQERTAELETQIQKRQRVEQQRALEQERARIAQDLHDELGSGITEIGMLAARAKTASGFDEKRIQYLEQANDKARAMVTALDEIVWVMNPAHDSLASLVSYFSLYADRFLGLANIAWRLDDQNKAFDQPVNSKLRHQLFLAFKEALHNVVRHSGATEVRIGIHMEQGELRLTIADNGRGLSSGERTPEMDGVDNMRSRIEKQGGRFEITGAAGRGTTVKFLVPLPQV